MHWLETGQIMVCTGTSMSPTGKTTVLLSAELVCMHRPIGAEDLAGPWIDVTTAVQCLVAWDSLQNVKVLMQAYIYI